MFLCIVYTNLFHKKLPINILEIIANSVIRGIVTYALRLNFVYNVSTDFYFIVNIYPRVNYKT